MPEVSSSGTLGAGPTEVYGPVVLAVDVGGTTIKGALIDSERTQLTEFVTPTRSANRSALESITAVVGELLDSASAAGVTVTAAGLAVPGLVDEVSGVVVHAANLDWTDLALRDIVTRTTGLPTTLLNDARAAALAEHQWGAARGTDDFVMVPIGTGVGGSVMCDGRILNGAHRAAGEIGHLIVVPDGEPCGCGHLGCVEAYVAGPAIARRFAAATGRSLTPPEIAALAGQDPAADQIWAEAAEALALALSALAAVTDPDLIVLGGGVAQAGRALIDPLTAALRDRSGIRVPPRITVAELGTQATRMGAALVALEETRKLSGGFAAG